MKTYIIEYVETFSGKLCSSEQEATSYTAAIFLFSLSHIFCSITSCEEK